MFGYDEPTTFLGALKDDRSLLDDCEGGGALGLAGLTLLTLARHPATLTFRGPNVP